MIPQDGTSFANVRIIFKMIYLAAIVAVLGILIFIYFNRYVERKRMEKRELHKEKQEEFLKQLLEAKKNAADKQENEEGNTGPQNL